MMRFFFNVQDGRDIQDSEGSELATRDEVREVALSTAGELLKKGGKARLWDGETWRMIVSDSAGAKVLALNFSAYEFPYAFQAHNGGQGTPS